MICKIIVVTLGKKNKFSWVEQRNIPRFPRPNKPVFQKKKMIDLTTLVNSHNYISSPIFFFCFFPRDFVRVRRLDLASCTGSLHTLAREHICAGINFFCGKKEGEILNFGVRRDERCEGRVYILHSFFLRIPINTFLSIALVVVENRQLFSSPRPPILKRRHHRTLPPPGNISRFKTQVKDIKK